jgi:hypothetical protein
MPYPPRAPTVRAHEGGLFVCLPRCCVCVYVFWLLPRHAFLARAARLGPRPQSTPGVCSREYPIEYPREYPRQCTREYPRECLCECPLSTPRVLAGRARGRPRDLGAQARVHKVRTRSNAAHALAASPPRPRRVLALMYVCISMRVCIKPYVCIYRAAVVSVFPLPERPSRP